MSQDGKSGRHHQTASTFAHLPEAFSALVPEIADLTWHEERRADCSACVMTAAVSGDDPGTPWVFDPDGRCCTFQPALANFLAGSALRRGGQSAEKIIARVERGTGVSAWGIRPTTLWRESYSATADRRFGRDVSLRCAYWVGGDHACGIWSDRPSTCRTWYCKHDHGLRGAAVWAQLQRVLAHSETLLAHFCIDRGDPPQSGATPERWLAWYRACSERIQCISRAELAALSDPALDVGRSDLVTLSHRQASSLPAVVVPSVEGTWPAQGGVRISGYSRYDTVVAAPSVYAFLAKLDGQRTWRAAQAEIAAEGREPLPDETIAELYRIGAIEAPGASNPTVLSRTPFPMVPDPADDANETDGETDDARPGETDDARPTDTADAIDE